MSVLIDKNKEFEFEFEFDHRTTLINF